MALQSLEGIVIDRHPVFRFCYVDVMRLKRILKLRIYTEYIEYIYIHIYTNLKGAEKLSRVV